MARDRLSRRRRAHVSAARQRSTGPAPQFLRPTRRGRYTVLIDRASPYTTTGEDHEGQRIAAGVDALLQSLNAGDRITIATIERQRRVLILVFGLSRLRSAAHESHSDFQRLPSRDLDQERKAFRRSLYTAVIRCFKTKSKRRA